MSKTLDEARSMNVDEYGHSDPFMEKAFERLEKLEKAIEIHRKAIEGGGWDFGHFEIELWDALKED